MTHPRRQPKNTRKETTKAHVNTDAHASTCTTNALKCIYTNADGLSNKMAELEIIINEKNPDLVLVT